MNTMSERAFLRAQIAIFVSAVILQLYTLIPRWRLHPTNSDDVYISVILRTWSPFGGDPARIRDDTYLLHWPFYLLGDSVLGQHRSTLFVISMTMNVIAVVLVVRFFFFVADRLLSDRRWVLVIVGAVTLWYASLGSTAADLMLRTSFRNLELGLICLLIQLSITTAEQPHLSRVRIAAVSVLGGLLMVDDPLSMYVVLGAAVFLGARSLPWRLGTESRRWLVSVLLASGAIVAIVVRWVLSLAGLDIVPVPATFISLNDLWASISNTLHWLLDVLHADVFGRDLHSRDTLLIAGRLTVLVVAGWLIWRHRQRLRGGPVVEVVFLVFAVTLLASLLSTNGLGAGNARYLVICVPLAAIGLIVASAHIERTGRWVLLIAISVVGISNCALTMRDVVASHAAAPDADPIAVVAALRAANLTHGYGGYWESYTYNYLSGGDVEVLEVGCLDGVTVINYGDLGRYRAAVDTSFFLFDTRPGVATCSLTELDAQFGPPLRTVPLGGTRSALVYSYDIGERITATTR